MREGLKSSRHAADANNDVRGAEAVLAQRRRLRVRRLIREVLYLPAACTTCSRSARPPHTRTRSHPRPVTYRYIPLHAPSLASARILAPLHTVTYRYTRRVWPALVSSLRVSSPPLRRRRRPGRPQRFDRFNDSTVSSVGRYTVAVLLPDTSASSKRKWVENGAAAAKAE